MPPTPPSFEFPADQEKTIGTLAQYMQIASGLLLAVGGLSIVAGIVSVINMKFAGLLSVIEGAIVLFMGMVLLAGSSDTRFIVDTKGNDLTHFINTIKSLGLYYKIQSLLGVLLVVILLIHFCV